MLTEMKIRTQLFIGFGIVIGMTIIVGFFALFQMEQLSHLTEKLYKHPLAISKAVRDVNISIIKMHRGMKDVALATNNDTLEAAVQAVNNDEKEVYKHFDIISERFLGDKQDVETLKKLFVEWKPIRDQVIALVREDRKEEAALITKGKGAKHVDNLSNAMKKLTDFANNKADEFLDTANNRKKQLYLWVIGVLVIVLLIGIGIAVMISRMISRKVTLAIDIANTIAEGNLDNKIEFNMQIEMGQLLQALDRMQTQLRNRIRELDNTQTELQKRLEEDKRIANEALRINRALDSVITSVLIADNEYKIIYLNEAAQSMFKKEEDTIRTELSHFDANHLLGATIDVFYKNPTQQRQLFAGLTSTHRSTLNVGGLTIDTNITPVINASGERLGTVFEFRDRTIEVATEQEINQIIQAASQGNFQECINLDNKAGFFYAFSESINKIIELNQVAIGDTMRMFAALAQGDLTQFIETHYTGAFGQLKEDANATVAQLTRIMTEIKQAADVVDTAADEISQGNSSLSQRTEQQAASLEETAASMEQMTGTVQQNADSAKQANQLSVKAKDRATEGGEVVNATIKAMSEISHSSKKITDIIGVINDIAFQTNLLALNAAVEAARAGEQGRGFAVVASEVRSLAQRSAAAAKEIRELIQDSVTKVEEGTKLANQSGETLAEIVVAVKKVSDIIAEMAAASQEQSSGIHQVNKAITQMDEMTQQNAALVEQAASASEAMREQVRNLKQKVTFFNLGEEILPLSNASQQYLSTSTASKKREIPNSNLSQSKKSNQIEDGWEEF